ncbi:MAG TPA: metal-dependent hydrolase [Planctomycetaceae bacterium]|nr:metal-dependent hydrolase [Planctomycetaceae bacterium]
MANYQTHLAVSGIMGVAYGTAASALCAFSPVHGALACCLTCLAGMLPDLDSETGRPVREVFGALAAATPFLMSNRLEAWAGGRDGAVLLALAIYVAIRYGGANLLALLAVHRGMFHSIPAMLIAAELAFLACKFDSLRVRLLLAGGVAVGFASHLALDELYSVKWDGALVALKSSAGSAVKFLSKNWSANIVAYGLLASLSYAVLVDTGYIQVLKPTRPHGALTRNARTR